MNNNPFLKQLISEIANKANEGRVDSNFGWGVLSEGKKKKKVVEADEKPAKKKLPEPTEEEPSQEPEAQEPQQSEEPKGPDAGGDLPDFGGGEKGGDEGGLPDLGADKGGEGEAAPEGEAPSDEDVADAQADANEKKAELEKAKAEKDQAEQEIEKNSYVKLGSSGGVQYLLGKILDHAFKTNSIDALASEMVQKLRIQTPEDFQAFSEEVAPYKILPGIGELLGSMKTMATKQSNEPESNDETEA